MVKGDESRRMGKGAASSSAAETQSQSQSQSQSHSSSLSSADAALRDPVRLCGYSSTKCGYCRGLRAWVVAASPLDSEEATKAKAEANAEASTAPDESNSPPSSAAAVAAATKMSSRSYGVHFVSLSPRRYQILLDGGWRRSGTHVYKPDNWSSCCPALSIRLDVERFYSKGNSKGRGGGMRRSHKKVLRTMGRILCGKNLAEVAIVIKDEKNIVKKQKERVDTEIKMMTTRSGGGGGDDDDNDDNDDDDDDDKGSEKELEKAKGGDFAGNASDSASSAEKEGDMAPAAMATTTTTMTMTPSPSPSPSPSPFLTRKKPRRNGNGSAVRPGPDGTMTKTKPFRSSPSTAAASACPCPPDGASANAAAAATAAGTSVADSAAYARHMHRQKRRNDSAAPGKWRGVVGRRGVGGGRQRGKKGDASNESSAHSLRSGCGASVRAAAESREVKTMLEILTLFAMGWARRTLLESSEPESLMSSNFWLENICCFKVSKSVSKKVARRYGGGGVNVGDGDGDGDGDGSRSVEKPNTDRGDETRKVAAASAAAASDGAFVILEASTSLCAALAGRSRGSLDREALALSLASALEDGLAMMTTTTTTTKAAATIKSNTDSEEDNSATPGGDGGGDRARPIANGRQVSGGEGGTRYGGEHDRNERAEKPISEASTLVSADVVALGVSAHGPSGKVNVYLRAPVPVPVLAPYGPGEYEIYNDRDGVDDSGENGTSSSLAAIEAEVEVEPRPRNYADADPEEADGNEIENTSEKGDTDLGMRIASILGLSRPPPGGYRLSVRSVPVRTSAGDPEVHRLYCRYQSAVHGDPDPFQDESKVKAKADSQRKEGKGKGKAEGESGKEGGGMIVDGGGNGRESSFVVVPSPAPNDFSMGGDGVRNGGGGDGGVANSDEEDEEESEACLVDRYDIDAVYPDLPAKCRHALGRAYSSFHRFLCETPLPSSAPLGPSSSSSSFDTRRSMGSSTDGDFSLDEDGYDTRVPYGTYHQQYRLHWESESPFLDGGEGGGGGSSSDGLLIAVGVVDVLPHCLSSVYSFYDPELSRPLQLGKYTALREIEWTKRALRFRPNLRYYYLGYYIHSCPKMRYKAEYGPAELLCPKWARWVDLDEAVKKIERVSPDRHCCPLWDPPLPFPRPIYGSVSSRSSSAAAAATLANPRPSEPTANRRDKATRGGKFPTSSDLDGILLDVGAGQLFSARDLNEDGRSVVDPLLSDFVKEVGADVAAGCIVQFF